MEEVIQEGVQFAAATNFHSDFLRQPAQALTPPSAATAAAEVAASTINDCDGEVVVGDNEIGVFSLELQLEDHHIPGNIRKRKLSTMMDEENASHLDAEFSAEKMIQQFDALTKDAEKVQKDVLRKILEENSEIEYFKRFTAEDSMVDKNKWVDDPEIFKSVIPIVSYESVRPFVDRIVGGDNSPILMARPVRALSSSSGTSEGQPKRVPFMEEMVNDYVQSMLTSYAFRYREYPIDESKKALQFLYNGKTSETESGITTGLVSTHIMLHPKFKLALRAHRVSPEEVLNSPDPDQALYCHLLCGLVYREEIQYVFTVFAHAMIVAFRSLEKTWDQLVDDIRTGDLSSRITVPSLRSAMSKIISRPNPKLADEINEICKELMAANWYGLVPKLFPNAKYVNTIVTGSAELYVPKLKVYAGGLPIVGNDYGSTEGWVGTNINPRAPPEEISFTIMPNIAYFEFIPLTNSGDNQNGDVKAVGLTEVKVGEEYEIVFTNFLGLYRYRLGDRVKVTGFYNSAPQVRYICRSNILLSINIDKITEKDLLIALEAGSKPLIQDGVGLADFTSYADKTDGKEHYIIYWELNGEASSCEVLQQCPTAMDLGFRELGYVNSRKSRGLGALELRVVKRGTFCKVFEHFVSSGGSLSSVQFKMPRAVNNSEVLRILDDHVINSYLSTAYA